MKWKKILTGTLAAAMLFSNASVANRNVMAKETAVVVICAIIIGVIVAVLDVGIQYGIQALVG